MKLTLTNISKATVVQLKANLSSLGMDTTGLKKDLYSRLFDVLTKEQNDSKQSVDGENLPCTGDTAASPGDTAASPTAAAAAAPAAPAPAAPAAPAPVKILKVASPFSPVKLLANSVCSTENPPTTSNSPSKPRPDAINPSPPVPVTVRPNNKRTISPSRSRSQSPSRSKDSNPKKVKKDDDGKRALIMTGFIRPFNLETLRNTLTPFGSIITFWVNPHRSICVVIYEDEGMAKKAAGEWSWDIGHVVEIKQVEVDEANRVIDLSNSKNDETQKGYDGIHKSEMDSQPPPRAEINSDNPNPVYWTMTKPSIKYQERIRL